MALSNSPHRLIARAWMRSAIFRIVSSPACFAMDTPDDDLTDDHMRLLVWLDAHPTGSLTVAAQALGLALTDPDHSNARSGRYLLSDDNEQEAGHARVIERDDGVGSGGAAGEHSGGAGREAADEVRGGRGGVGHGVHG
jgi:hypothetical protein